MAVDLGGWERDPFMRAYWTTVARFRNADR